MYNKTLTPLGHNLERDKWHTIKITQLRHAATEVENKFYFDGLEIYSAIVPMEEIPVNETINVYAAASHVAKVRIKNYEIKFFEWETWEIWEEGWSDPNVRVPQIRYRQRCSVKECQYETDFDKRDAAKGGVRNSYRYAAYCERLLSKISIFDQAFHFYQFSIFEQKFHFDQFLTFDQKFLIRIFVFPIFDL